MSDDKNPAPADHAQLDGFLRWRHANVRRRAARRRRRHALMASLAIIVLALVAGVAELARDARGGETLARGPAPAESVAAAPPASAPAARPSAPPAGPPAVEDGPRVTAPRAARVERLERSRETSQARPVPSRPPAPEAVPAPPDRSRTSAAAAVALTPDSSPDPGPATPLIEEPVPGQPESVATVAPALPEAGDAERAEAASTEVGQSPVGHRQPKSRVVTARVVSWLEGEVQEVRDTAKREIGEFRAGFDKVRSCLAWLRGEGRSGCRAPAPRP